MPSSLLNFVYQVKLYTVFVNNPATTINRFFYGYYSTGIHNNKQPQNAVVPSFV